MIINTAAGLVKGGFNAIGNVIGGIGKGISTLTGAFFPTPQRTTLQSEITAGAEGYSRGYRDLASQGQSINESNAYWMKGWDGSPYQAQYSKNAMTAESQSLAAKMTGGVKAAAGGIGGMLADVVEGAKWAGKQAKEIRTAVDEIFGSLGLRSPIGSGPAEIGNSPGRTRNTDPGQAGGANVWTMLQSAGKEIVEQAKGLFNIGYQDGTGQPAFSISHEISPSGGLSTMLIVGFAILIAVIIFKGKK